MEQEEQTENKNGEKKEEREEATEESFLKELYFFMKQRDSPIERIPHLGFKQIDLYLMYKTVKDLGGYHQVTAQQLWKKVYNILGGNPRSTSAATCTRRHYEKLLLPYEYHQAGYGDEIPITPPRKHKLSHSFDDQYFLGPKRPVIRHVLFNQHAPHDFLTDARLRTISMPGSSPQYLHPGPTSLPNLFSLPQSMPPIPHFSTPIHTRIPVSYPPASPFETESFKQPLKFLRHLADEYKTSSGLVEPLNLSNKKGSLETSSNTPSSFSPPSSKKRPKFLNEALPLYTSRGDQPAAAAGPLRVDPPVQAIVNPMSMDGPYAVNLTSSSESSPTLKKATPSATPLLADRPSCSSAFSTKQPEQSPHVPLAKAGSSEKPQSSPSQDPSRPPLDPYGGMEIQIPLFLLQNWIKEGLISSLASTRQHPSGGLSNEPIKTPTPEPLSRGRISSEASEGLTSGVASICQQPHRVVPQDSNKTPSSPDSLSWGKISSQSSDSPTGDLPADLSMKNHVRDPVNPSKHDSASTASPTTINEIQLPTINRFASVKPFIMTPSTKMLFSREPYHRISHIKSSQAEEQDASPKQGNSVANTRNKDSAGPKSPCYGADLTPSLAARLGKALEKVPMAKRNSTSSPLIQLTPEQLKLLLSSSAFRLERGKIC